MQPVLVIYGSQTEATISGHLHNSAVNSLAKLVTLSCKYVAASPFKIFF